MRLSTTVADVKSLVESSSDLNQNGNELIMYDIHTRIDGTLFQYMDNQEVEYNADGWLFKDGSNNTIDIPWTKQGHHHFFAFLSKYGTKTLPFTVTYSPPSEGGRAEDQSISIAEHTIQNSNQFDFLYATHARNVVSQGTGTVPLEMQHLFASVQFQILNMSGSVVRVNSFKIDGMRVTGSAIIGYDENPEFELSEAPVDNAFSISGKEISNVVGTLDALHGGPFMIWPHRPDFYKDLKCTFNYSLGGGSPSNIEVYLTAANSGVTSWDAGYRYIYTITISDHILFDVVRVVDWINDDVVLN